MVWLRTDRSAEANRRARSFGAFREQREELLTVGTVRKPPVQLATWGVRLHRDVVVQGEVHDQSTFMDLALSGHIRDIVDQEVGLVDNAKRVAVVLQTPQVGATSDQCV